MIMRQKRNSVFIKGALFLWFSILSFLLNAQPPNDTLIFLSDTQSPLFVETIIHRTPYNNIATRLIFEDIIKRKPQNIFLLGDVVAAGSKQKRWNEVDAFLDSLKCCSANVCACLGNHEYIYNSKIGEGAFQKRFPQHSKTGYYVIRDSIAILMMNSNFSKLTKAELQTQQAFYEKALETLDKSDSVKTIIVACHHSPYSNSKVVGSNKKVQDAFVTSFLKSPKCKLFLSGHSHNFEHFKIKGKDFLVIGGGGGVHQRLNTKSNPITGENMDFKPLFHYLLMKRQEDKLILIIREINKDYKDFSNSLTFSIDLKK